MADSAAAAEELALDVVGCIDGVRAAGFDAAEPGVPALPAIDESLFLASATAPVPAGLAGAAATLDPAAEVDDADGAASREVDDVVAADLGVPVVLVDVAGFRAAAVVEAVLDVGLAAGALPGDDTLPEGATEVRLAVVDVAEAPDRFFSSSDTEGCDLCEAAVDEDVVGRLAATVDPAGGRVGGLLSPPAAERAAEAAAGLVAGPPVMPGRRAVLDEAVVEAVETRLAPVELVVLAALAGALASLVVDLVVLGDVVASEGGASSWWTTSNPSASDMFVGPGRRERRGSSRHYEPGGGAACWGISPLAPRAPRSPSPRAAAGEQCQLTMVCSGGEPIYSQIARG